MKVIAVTGASGFLGAHIVKAALAEDPTWRVNACVRNADDREKHRHLLEMDGHRVVLFESDLLVEGSFDAAFAQADVVIHAAAVLASKGDPQKTMVDPSVKGTENVLNSIRRSSHVRTYIHTSSVAAVAKVSSRKTTAYTDADWSDATIETSPYNFAKTEGEKVVWKAQFPFPLKIVVMNPAYVLGECLHKAHSKASPFIFRQALLGNKQFNIVHSVVDVKDVAVAHVRAISAAGVDRKRFLLSAPGGSFSTVGLIKKAAGMYPHLVFDPLPSNPASAPPVPEFISHDIFDSSPATKLLNIQFSNCDKVVRDSVESIVSKGYLKPRSKL